jgi:two-component system chemotaxis response regulator CheB
VIGVLFSGMMNDGVAGLWAIKTCGGVTLVQDPADARFSEMPQGAVDTLPVDHCLPVAGLAPRIGQLRSRARARRGELPRVRTADIRDPHGRPSQHRDPDMDKIGKLSPFTCPSCHGSL